MVPAGSFQMGTLAADIEWLKYARPVHTVTLSRPFLLQRTPVTVAQFRSFVEATGYRTEAERGDGSFVDTGKWEKKPDGNWRNPYFGQADDCPVVCVSWNDAQAYIRWLNSKLSAVTYRLPTEAEWEYACRAGSVGETYGPLDAVAWYNGNSGGRTHPVGQKQPNAWGLFDTLGNAEQWCQDLWRDYTVDAQTDPRGSSTGSSRVFRGGSWGLGPGWCWAGFRSWLSPDESSAHLGFRLVRALP
jgi:formylglycine-generating enzyme required for sulfatase activity